MRRYQPCPWWTRSLLIAPIIQPADPCSTSTLGKPQTVAISPLSSHHLSARIFKVSVRTVGLIRRGSCQQVSIVWSPPDTSGETEGETDAPPPSYPNPTLSKNGGLGGRRGGLSPSRTGRCARSPHLHNTCRATRACPQRLCTKENVTSCQQALASF